MEPSKTERIVVPILVGVLLAGGWGYGISQFWWRKPSTEPVIAARVPTRTVSPGVAGGRGIAAPAPVAPFVPSDPQWREKFDKVYTLAAGEAVKRIAPPFIAERDTFVRVQYNRGAGAMPTVGSLIFRFQNNQAQLPSTSPLPTRPMGSIVSLITSLNPSTAATSPTQIEMSQALQTLGVAGDWIYRPDTPVDQRTAALATALGAATGKKLTIAQEQVDRTGFAVSGTYEFKPLEGNPENTTIHLYSDVLDPAGTNASSGSVPITQLPSFIGSIIGGAVTSEMQAPAAGGSVTIRIHNSASNIQRMSPGPERDALIEKLIANFSAQTGLECKKMTTKVQMWRLVEAG